MYAKAGEPTTLIWYDPMHSKGPRWIIGPLSTTLSQEGSDNDNVCGEEETDEESDEEDEEADVSDEESDDEEEEEDK